MTQWWRGASEEKDLTRVSDYPVGVIIASRDL